MNRQVPHAGHILNAGFTMVELIIVVLIISVMVFFSVPVFKNSGFFQGRDKGVNQLILMIQSLKQRSIDHKKDYSLHFSQNTARVWIIDSAMDEQAREKAAENGMDLLGNWQLTQVKFPGDSQHNQRHPVIGFSQKGYSDMAIIHLTDGERSVSLKIEPFLMEIQQMEGHVSFDDCR